MTARRRFTSAQGYRPIDLLQAATDHLFSANILFAAPEFFRVTRIMEIDLEAPRCLDSAGYLSHLGIELILKTFLLLHRGDFPDEHSLTTLLAILEDVGVKIVLDEEQTATLARLDKFYRLRYPQTEGSPSVGSLDWTAIHSLASKLGDQLPANLQQDVSNIDRTKKFGRILLRKPKKENESPFAGHVLVVKSRK